MNDYIKRGAVLSTFLEYGIGWGAAKIKGVINSIPAADVRENVHAHWVEMPPYTHHQPKDFECSACHESEIRKTRFCPNCGAIMDEEANR